MSDVPVRPDLYVVVRLLEALWRSGNRMGRTQLQNSAGLNYAVYSRYLELLERRGLVSVIEDGGTTRVELTPRGLQSLRFLIDGMKSVLGP